ncbi:MAG TPA: pilin [Gammaproteobacteria bacterium]|nr:pilin [Gammaproteobacteria bacterium]
MNTYLTQSKVSDAIQSVAPVQSSVVNKIASLGTTTGSGTGVTVPTTLSRYISTCTVSANGVITVTTTSSAGAISFTLTPSYDTPTETVSWVCAVSSSASDPSVPNECRI